MKVKSHRNKKDSLFYLILLVICSFTNAIRLKAEQNTSSSNSLINSQINQTQKPNLKEILQKSDTTNFEFFKNFILNLFKIQQNKEATSDNSPNNLKNNLSKIFFSKKIQNLNFYNDAVKVVSVPYCNLDSCEKQNGMCISDTQCKCNYGFINYPSISSSQKVCDYKLSFQLYALMLEIFLPFGLGHIYCKRYLIGFIKFLVLLIIPICGFFIKKKIMENKEGKYELSRFSKENNHNLSALVDFNKFFSYFISTCFFLIFLTWYVFDLVIFSANKHKDGSGFDLIPI